MEKYSNNISNLLDERKISIRKMGIDLNMDYAFVHNLVTRKSLSETHLSTLDRVAKYLGVKIEDLYKKEE